MQPATSETSTCPLCGRALEGISGGGLGCVVCLFRVGIGGEDDFSQDQAAFESHEHFGIYEIDRRKDGGLYELGHGAMGATYRATDTTLQRKVALKIVRLAGTGPSHDARERFLREARAAATLRHQNIATVFQFGIREETGQLFYAMELIEGETLEERVRRAGPLDVSTTIGIAQQVTVALIAAEKRGVIHRDLKPENLMLVDADDEVSEKGARPVATGLWPVPGMRAMNRWNWTAHRAVATTSKPIVKIIDFGLAKALHAPVDPTHLTHHGFVGTPAFASPEQFENSALDVRSDIYSLGATLWFALTGRTPFTGRSVKEIRRAQKSNALPLEQLKAAHVPSRLRSLLKSMLAVEPAARPGTHKLAAQLQRCADEVSGARRKRVALAGAAILILGAFAFLVFELWQTGRRPVATVLTPSIQEKSVAVLPFENLSRDPDNAYLAEGIQEEILTRLAKIAELKVISRTSTQQYQSKPRNLSEIAKQLAVANILEGSVQKVADQVRVNVQLINAQTDSHLWAETYDQKLTDIFRVESEIAKGIAESLQAKLTGREEQALAVKPTNNPEAYDAYLRGLAFAVRAASDDILKAAEFYERAVQLDPNFALAWARLSRAHGVIFFNFVEPTTARRDAAKRALESAQKLAPNSPETLLALGYYQYWVLRDYAFAKITFGRVSQMLPGNSDVLTALGRVTRREGHWDQSIAYFEGALVLDPRNVQLLWEAAHTYAILRQFPAALKLYDRALNITPNDPEAMALKAGINQAQGNLQEAASFLSGINEQTPNNDNFGTKIHQLRLERNYNEAIRLLQARLAQFHFDSDYYKADEQVDLAFMQRLAGDTAGARVTAEQARNILEQLCRDQPDRASFAGHLSEAYALMGLKDLALKVAERAIMLSPRTKDAMRGPAFEENLALIQTIVGENSGAISTLAQLSQTPYDGWLYDNLPITPAFLRLDPLWDTLRSDPAFQKLCEEKRP
jgi:serine/threonine protein kinase/Tfp pilus assembly protein PilF